MILDIRDKVLDGIRLDRGDVLELIEAEGSSLFELFAAANIIREHYRKNIVDICSIVNAKSGNCSEDCAYCAQALKSNAVIDTYPLKDKEYIIEAAKDAKGKGAKRFCVVTGGKKPSRKELDRITVMVSEVKQTGLLPCATLGLLDKEELQLLHDAGLTRYHHNLETSERFFPKVCSTHTFSEKLETINAVKEIGISLCSGGIFGLGETWDDRLDMLFMLRELNVDSVPINFLTPINGTPLGKRNKMHPLEALKVVSISRFILPEKEIRICGGRSQTLGEFNSFIFIAGADGLLIGNYLTTTGRPPDDDIRLIKDFGLQS